jgi:beta-glucosidase
MSTFEFDEKTIQSLSVLPKGFRWGVATSAYQVEGATDLDGRGLSTWDLFETKPGAVRNGDSGALSANHYFKYPEDFKLMNAHNIDSYRFSVAWPRIFPDGFGSVNQKGLDHYERKIDLLLNFGIEPTVTLFHWDLPYELEKAGGWYNRDTAKHFSDYAELVVRRLGDRVKRWITINEPWTIVSQGYCLGLHAPGHTDYRSAGTAIHHLLLAHGLAAQAIRSYDSKSSLGITNILSRATPWSNAEADVRAAELMDAERNTVYLEPLFKGHYPQVVEPLFPTLFDNRVVQDGDLSIICSETDFVGTNYYLDQIAKANPAIPILGVEIIEPTGPQMTTGTAIRPEGLYWAIKKTREYTELPQYITEVGVCLPDYVNPEGEVNDPERIKYLDSCLHGIAKSISEGCDVRGLFVWSLLDNLEWNQGYLPRFGLFYVNYKNQERIPKLSAQWYSALILKNRSEEALRI